MALSLITLPMLSMSAFASHGTGGYFWTSSSQEFYCESNLSNLTLTSSVNSACDAIEDAAERWTNLSDPSWSLTKSTSDAINQRAVNMGTAGAIAEMVPTEIFGIMISAYVQYNTEVSFGDVDVDSEVFDFPTVAIHELGHLPTMLHNGHSESNSVMNAGLDLDEKRRTITSNDTAALEAKYP